MSNILRALRLSSPANRHMSRGAIEELLFRLTGQQSNIPDNLGAESLGDPAADYLNDPGTADLLMKNAKAMNINDLLRQARSEDGNPQMAPMIASISQLDR